jgi:DNA (cytosine-5)-methyltransferase 1
MSGPLVLSLFPGIGLLDLAFEQEGFCVVRGPDVIFNSLSDIRTFHPPAGRFDGIIGGPPCQSFSSLAHIVRANGHEPRFGNLIPEFERCVREAQPTWFLMENVRAAPEPKVEGYGVDSFLLNNAWLHSENGLGQEQERLRRFSFGMRGRAPNLLNWIDLACLLLPEAGTVTQHEALTDGHDRPPSQRHKAVCSKLDEVPVKIGGSGKRKKTVCAMEGSNKGTSVGTRRYSIAEACRLQGLPEDFLADSPFRADAKLKAIANGVPLPMGLAIARAVSLAMCQASNEPDVCIPHSPPEQP